MLTISIPLAAANGVYILDEFRNPAQGITT